MPRITPTTKIDVIGNLDLQPQDAIGEYLVSKEHKQAMITHKPNWDSAGDSTDLTLIRNRREYDDMLIVQKSMLQQQVEHTHMNEQRIDMLYKHQQQIRKRFIEVNEFMRECVSNRQDSEQKVNEQKSIQADIKKKCDEVSQDTGELSDFLAVLKETVKEFEPYEQVVLDACEKTPMFSNVKDCMSRCDALMIAQVSISEMEELKLYELEQMRKEMVNITNIAKLKMLGLQNELIDMERGYNTQYARVFKWEKIFARAKNVVRQKSIERVRVLESIQQIYRLLCLRREISIGTEYMDAKKMLNVIKEEYEILTLVLEECQAENRSKPKTQSWSCH